MRRFVAIVSIIAACALALPPAAVSAATPLPSDAAVVVQGHGWGHGRGMGQWGAKGMAGSGKAWTSIVTHYYSGITLGTRSTAEDIRVLVGQTSTVVVTSDAAFGAWSGSLIATSDATHKFFRARYSGSSYVLDRAAAWSGPWTQVATRAGSITFKPGSAVLQLVSSSGSVRYYRGTIEGRLSTSGTLYAINALGMQQYLYGSVPREMPASWPAEALRAQSVAARTYAAYKKDYARSKGYVYDICATTSCQVYGGYASKSSPTSTTVTKLEYSSSNAAVDATAGRVMLYGGKPVLSEYSSSTGGYTAPGNVGYLKPVPDPADATSPLHDWDSTLKVSTIEAKWPAIGRLVNIAVTKRNGYGEWGGRVLEMQLIGTSGTVTLSGESFKNAFAWPAYSDGMLSNFFRVLVWKGDFAGASVPMLISGSTATMTVLARNSGTASWPVGGAVRLATSAESRFSGSGWISPTRPATVFRNRTSPSKTAVGPGEVAEFRVPLHAEAVKPGSYAETMRVVDEGVTSMSAWFTVRIPVLPGWIEEAANHLTNGSFESQLAAWSPSGLGSGEGATTAASRDGRWSLVLKGGSKRVTETVRFAGAGTRRFTLGGWSRADGTNASGGPIALTAGMRYTDGTTGRVHLSFARAPHAWAYDEVSFVASKPLTYLQVTAWVDKQTGAAFFDAIRLLETPVTNPSFEDGLGGWNASGFSGGDGSVTGDARDGIKALRLTGDAATSANQYLSVSGRRSETFRLGAWNATAGSTLTGPKPSLQAVFVNRDGTRSAVAVEFPAGDHGWTYAETMARAPKDFSRVILVASYNGQSGTARFDSIRFTRTFLENSSFESASSGWISLGGTGAVSSPVRDAAGAFTAGGTGRTGAYQRVSIVGSPGRKLLLSGWTAASGTSAGGGPVALLALFINTDGSTTKQYLDVARTPHGWTYAERVVTSPKGFSAVFVYLLTYDQPGAVTFDSIRLSAV